MATQLDWGKLVAQGRVKAPGMPWTQEEFKAIQSGMDPDDVRAGFLSKESLENASPKKLAETRLDRMRRPELVLLAKQLGIDFSEEDITKADLILEIQRKQSASPEEETNDSNTEEESEE